MDGVNGVDTIWVVITTSVADSDEYVAMAREPYGTVATELSATVLSE